MCTFLGGVPMLYPGALATVSRPFGTLDSMWLAFQTLANNETHSISGEKYFALPASSAARRSSAQSGVRYAGPSRD